MRTDSADKMSMETWNKRKKVIVEKNEILKEFGALFSKNGQNIKYSKFEIFQIEIQKDNGSLETNQWHHKYYGKGRMNIYQTIERVMTAMVLL